MFALRVMLNYSQCLSASYICFFFVLDETYIIIQMVVS